MKVGDRVYCINTRQNEIDVKKFDYNTKGKIYNILKIKGDIIYLSCNKNKYHISCQYRYNNKKDDNFFDFEDYFITLKESRNKKLKTINENILQYK